jgi:hypothetical protein
MNKPKGVGLSPAEMVPDSVIPGSPVATECEASYRRGYHQGVVEALFYLQDGIPYDVLMGWALGPLREWRTEHDPWRRGRTVKAVTPPYPLGAKT